MPLLACTPARDAPTIDAMSDTPGTPHDFRAEFPVTEQYAFLNHAAVAPIPLATQMAIMEFARDAAEEGPVNYSAWLHSMALARQAAGQLLACEPDDVCFTKSTNHGALIVANSLDWREGDNVVGLEHEFPANMMPWHNLRGRGVEFRVVPERPDHTYSIDDIAAAMDARTRLLAVSWVEYSTGVRNDIAALGALCRERGALFGWAHPCIRRPEAPCRWTWTPRARTSCRPTATSGCWPRRGAASSTCAGRASRR